MTFSALQGTSLAPDSTAAVAEIVRQISGEDLDVVFFFCSPSYDLDTVGRELKRSFACPVVGCSSSGQVGPGGFQQGGMTAMSLSGGYLQAVPHLIHPLADFQDRAVHVAEAFRDTAGGRRLFGFLLIDGLSMMEERLTSALYQALDDVPIVGGSAGDDLHFERTYVYYDGQFLTDAAVLTACRTRAPFAPFMLKHFVSGDVKLVITDADPEKRVIREFNGEPAALVYAGAIGVEVDQLSPEIFSRHPLLLGIGGDQYVRSIATANADMSLSLYCAIETGLVITLGETVDPLATLQQAFKDVLREVPDPIAILACDCVLRRLEFENLGTDREIGDFLVQHHVLGFSTYGEQFNGLHVNQTLTGIALGRMGEA